MGSYPQSGCEQHVFVHSDGNVFGARALLQEELVVRAEEEDAERSVEQAAGLFGDEPVRRTCCPSFHDVIPFILR